MDAEVWGQSRVAGRLTWCQVLEEPVHDQISVRAMAANKSSGPAARMEGGKAGSQEGYVKAAPQLHLWAPHLPSRLLLSSKALGPTTFGPGLVHSQTQP